MPIFEEKLICPLAVHFTQEHIRPAFQDGRDIEDAVKAITLKPGTGVYDVILEAEFPVIEIMRWHERGAKSASSDASHWFTVDNRRLYCLQRMAAALWPRRVGVLVEVFYAAPDGALRKSDSSTGGRSVGIGHSLKDLKGRWDWREDVAKHKNLSSAAVRAAEQLVIDDNEKSTVGELLDAPAPPSMLALFTQGAGNADLKSLQTHQDFGSEGSTRSPSASRSSDTCFEEHPTDSLTDVTLKALDSCLVGKWETETGEIYQISASTETSWRCVRKSLSCNRKKTNKVELWYDSHSDAVCWGPDWALYLDVSDLRAKPNSIAWFSGKTLSKSRPRFSWHKVVDGKSMPELDMFASQCHLKEKLHETSPNVVVSPNRSRKRGNRR